MLEEGRLRIPAGIASYPRTEVDAMESETCPLIEQIRKIAMTDPSKPLRCVHNTDFGRRCKSKLSRRRRIQAKWLASKLDLLKFTEVKKESVQMLLIALHCGAHRNEVEITVLSWWDDIQDHLAAAKQAWANIWHPYNARWEQLLEYAEAADRCDHKGTKGLQLSAFSSALSLQQLQTVIPWPTKTRTAFWMVPEEVKQFHLLSMAAVEPVEVARRDACHEVYNKLFLEGELKMWVPLCVHFIERTDLEGVAMDNALIASSLYTVLRGISEAMESCNCLQTQSHELGALIDRLSDFSDTFAPKAEARCNDALLKQESSNYKAMSELTEERNETYDSTQRNWMAWISRSLVMQ